MVVERIQTLVFQCSSCGMFYFDTISLFHFSGEKTKTLKCRCKNASIDITLKQNKKIIMRIPCFLCNEVHTYTFSIGEFFSNTLKIIRCPKKNMKIGFVGKDDSVRNALDSHENFLNGILEEMGIPQLCKNAEVVIESINYIHDLAEDGKIHCECGNNKIEMDVLTNKVKLRCSYCGNETSLLTRNNEDLRCIQTQSVIYLQKNKTKLI